MSEEKNHEEMADEQTVEMAAVIYTGGVLGISALDIAKILYAKCYRKQSEGIANNATTTGKWVWKSNGYMKSLHCSCCGRQEEWETTYCPNCGAKMKGAANEQK